MAEISTTAFKSQREIMSRSYHVTAKDFKKLTKKELEDMALDPKSKLNEWATKSSVKKTTAKQRKELKQKKSRK